MATLREHAAACALSFRKAKVALDRCENDLFRRQFDRSTLDDEHGRFKVFCGNLGVLQRGHSSLDYRLRDSPLLQGNVRKLLVELHRSLEEAYAVLAGSRPPYEQAEIEDTDDDSASETSSMTASSIDEDESRSELEFRLMEIIDIIDNLYKLSIRIRVPTLDTRATKAATFRQIDKDTKVDLIAQFASFDEQHTIETLRSWREDRQKLVAGDIEQDPLVPRLSGAITRRRQQFKYWKKHRAKLAASESRDADRGKWAQALIEFCLKEKWDSPIFETSSEHRDGHLACTATVSVHGQSYSALQWYEEHQAKDAEEDAAKVALLSLEGNSYDAAQEQEQSQGPEDPGTIQGTSETAETLKPPISEHRPKTLLSGTEATTHHKSLDDEILETQTVTSIATTAKDLSGQRIDLPPPPSSANDGRDFECPYCFVICPSKYSGDRGWRNHLLQDLQPYVCTYGTCSTGGNLYRSRRDWLEHERSAHRRIWRCPTHPQAIYKAEKRLEKHFHEQHQEHLTDEQLQSLIKASETSTEDDRQHCPICLVESKSIPNLAHHLANHLERLAAFALPKDADTADDVSGGSNDAHQGLDSESSGTIESVSSVVGPFGEEQEDLTEEVGRLALENRQLRRPDPANLNRKKIQLEIESAIEELRDGRRKIDLRLIPVARGLLDEVVALQELIESPFDDALLWIWERFQALLKKLQKVRMDHVNSLISEIRELCEANLSHHKPIQAQITRYLQRLDALAIVLHRWHMTKPFENTCAVARLCLAELGSMKRVLLGDVTEVSLEAMSESLQAFIDSMEHAYEQTTQNTQMSSLVMIRKQLLERSSAQPLDPDALAALPDDRDNRMVHFEDGQEPEDPLGRQAEEEPEDTAEERPERSTWDDPVHDLPSDDIDISDILQAGFSLNARLEKQDIPIGWQQTWAIKDRASLIESLTVETRRTYGRESSIADAFTKSMDFERECFRLSENEDEYVRKINDRAFYLEEVRRYNPILSQPRRRKVQGLRFQTRELPPPVSAHSIPTVSWYQSCAVFQPSEHGTNPVSDYSFMTGKSSTQKVALVGCDILSLEVDAIVNPVGKTLNPGSGFGSFLNTYLHELAGPEFAEECRAVQKIHRGDVLITGGGDLRCQHVIHASRPTNNFSKSQDDVLRTCYRKSLELAVRKGIKSIAFPCLSTGGYGFPKMQAADIAIGEVATFFRLQAEYGPAKDATNALELVIFCAVQQGDLAAYKQLLPRKFPRYIQQDMPLHSVKNNIRPSTVLMIRDVLFNQASILGTSHEETQMTLMMLANLSRVAESYYAQEIPHSCFAMPPGAPALARWQLYWTAAQGETTDAGFHRIEHDPSLWPDESLHDLYEVEFRLAKLIWVTQSLRYQQAIFSQVWRDFEKTIRLFMYGSAHNDESPLPPQDLLQAWQKHLTKKYIAAFELELQQRAFHQQDEANTAMAWSLAGILMARGEFNDAAQANARCQHSYDGLTIDDRQVIDKYWSWALVLWLTRIAIEESATLDGLLREAKLVA